MHAVFMLYGKLENVNYLLRDLAAQKLTLNFHKEGEPDQFIWTGCQVRLLPGGIYELIFPKEHKDTILTSLNFHKKGLGHGASIEDYGIDKEIKILGMSFKPLDYVKKFLRVEDPGEFKTDKALIWETQFVSIIPLGIRHDPDRIGLKGESMEGWWHEAL